MKEGSASMGTPKEDNNNGFELSDERMDFLIKEAVRLELEKKKILDLGQESSDDSKKVNVYA